jgi:hypothetical protein
MWAVKQFGGRLAKAFPASRVGRLAKNDHFHRSGSPFSRPGGHFWQKTGVFGLRRPSGCGGTTSLAAGTTSADGGGTSLDGRATSVRRAPTSAHDGTTAFRAPTTSVERPGGGPLSRNDVAASPTTSFPVPATSLDSATTAFRRAGLRPGRPGDNRAITFATFAPSRDLFRPRLWITARRGCASRPRVRRSCRG